MLTPSGMGVWVCCGGQGRVSIVSMLLDKGARVSDRTHKGNTPLHLASQGGHHEAVALLLRAGAKPNDRNKEGGTPLHAACWKVLCCCREGDGQPGEEVMGGADVCWVVWLYGCGHWQGHQDVVRCLLSWGANAAETTLDGRTCLHLAAQSGSLQAVQVLLHPTTTSALAASTSSPTAAVTAAAATTPNTASSSYSNRRGYGSSQSKNRSVNGSSNGTTVGSVTAPACLPAARARQQPQQQQQAVAASVVSGGAVGLDVNACSRHGHTALTTAIVHGQHDVVALLLTRQDVDLR